MEHVITGLNHWLRVLPEEFKLMTTEEINERPLPHKWSKKEILGHLCDSAINNMNRFIRIQYEDQPYVIQPYKQDNWVALQHYQDLPFEEILTLFTALNKQIVHILSNVPKERLSYLLDIGNNRQHSLEWLINDYLEHMEHHIKKQILVKNNGHY